MELFPGNDLTAFRIKVSKQTEKPSMMVAKCIQGAKPKMEVHGPALSLARRRDRAGVSIQITLLRERIWVT